MTEDKEKYSVTLTALEQLDIRDKLSNINTLILDVMLTLDIERDETQRRNFQKLAQAHRNLDEVWEQLINKVEINTSDNNSEK